jgi:YVTN family beta-propeller protein
MRISKAVLVLLSLVLLTTCLAAQTSATSNISSPQPASLSPMTPAVASPAPIVRPAPSRQAAPEKPQPNVNLQVPAPRRARVRRIAMIEIPGRPGFKGVALLGDALIMAHPAADTVDVFSVRKRRLVAQLNDMKGASGIAADPSSGRVFVADSGANEIVVISSKDWKVQHRIALKASPNALLFVPQTDTLYSSNWRDQSISLIDTRQSAAINTVAVEGRPEYLVYDPVNKQIFVALQDSRQVIALDPSLKVIKRFPLVASQPTGLALDAKARRLYVAVRYAVLALDADTGRELRRVAAPAGIDMLWLDEAGNSLYGGSSDGTIAWMRTLGGTLSPEYEFKTDVRGQTFAFDPGKKMIYLPGGRDGRSKLLIMRQVEPNEATARPEVAEK